MSSAAALTSCKLYLLRRSTILEAQFGANVQASEITSYLNSAALQELKESTRVVPEACLEPVLVLLASGTCSGKIFTPEDRPIQYATAQGIDLSQSPFCLFHQPAMVRVSPADSKQDARQIVVDLAASLVSHIPLLQSIFSMSTYEFSFRAVMPTSETWLHSQLSLLEHRFDPNVAFLELVSMKNIISKWKEMVLGNDGKPERVGYLFKQSSSGKETKQTPSLRSSLRPSKAEKKQRRQTESHLTPAAAIPDDPLKNYKSLRKKSKRWFVMKGLFLAYFKTRDDSLPACVIPLDYYIVRLWDDYKKGERVVSLEKYVPSFPRGMLEDLVLATEPENENELRLWFQSTNGKCANTALNRVFGMPLLHQLCHNQHGYVKKPTLGSEDPLFYLPPFLTQCVKFLAAEGIDQEGLFRVSHTTNDVLTYREFFDTGSEIDLEGTSPHCVAGLIKSWLRELPEPLIPNDMYPVFLQTVATTKDKELKRERVLELLEHLPLHSLRALSFLANFMKQIVSYAVLNRMTFQSLSIVLAPCILRQSDALNPDAVSDYNPLQLLRETPQINEIVLIVFENSDAVAASVARLNEAEEKRNLQKSISSPALTSTNSMPSPTVFASSTSMNNVAASQAKRFAAASEAPTLRASPKPLLSLSESHYRPRVGSNGVIHSLNEVLPPLKEGEISGFTPSGCTPTVTIEPSPRSLRSSSPKWGRRHRNTVQWKGGAVGNGRVSGSTSPVPPVELASSDHSTDDDVFLARRGSEDAIGHNLHLDARFLSVTSAQAGYVPETMSLPVSPRSSAWSQPVSPDPEARMINMIMSLQNAHEALVSRVAELEHRLSKETALRTNLELKLAALAPNHIQ